MNTSKAAAEMSDQELNAAVARAMGWKWRALTEYDEPFSSGDTGFWYAGDDKVMPYEWRPSTDANDAIRAVSGPEWQVEATSRTGDGHWHVNAYTADLDHDAEATAPTFARALSLAFLAAKGSAP